MARIAKIIHVLLLIGVGGMFIYAGIAKAADPAAFALDIDRYRILPWSGVALQALYLPWLEIACGGALFFRRTRMGSLWLLLAMMLVFLMALLSAWMRGLDIRCGCFGSTEAGAPIPIAIMRDLGILGALLFLFWKERPNTAE